MILQKQFRIFFIGTCIFIVIISGCTSQPVEVTETATPLPIEEVAQVDIETAVPTSTPASTETAQPTQSPTPSPTLPPTHTPEPTFTPTPIVPFQDVKPLLAPGPKSWESAFIDPGGIVYHDGLFHMFYNGLSGWPAHVKVGYATSEDGLSWTRMADEPVFTGEGIAYTGVSIFVSSAIILDNNQWALYFYTIDTGNFSGPGKMWSRHGRFTLWPICG